MRPRPAAPALLLAFALALAPIVSLGAGARHLAPADELERLAAELRGDDFAQRREAVRGLVRLGTEPALELVLAVLGDAEPGVADEAQLALGGVTSETALRLIAGKRGMLARNSIVRLRACEALGRVPIPVDAELFLKPLKAREPETRCVVLWSVERLARAGRLAGDVDGKLGPALERVHLRDREEIVSASALSALAAASPEAVLAHAREALGHRAAPLRAAALEVLGGSASGESLAISVEMLEDPAPAVRTMAVRYVARHGGREAVRALVARLGGESESRLAFTIVGALQELTDRKIGLDAEAWERWYETLSADWQPADSRSPADLAGRSVALAGLPLLSDRIVFLVDFSGSVWEMQADGSSGKEQVARALRLALEALDGEARFNVVPYADAPVPWKKALVPATRANVRKALDFFQGCGAYGKGDLWAALLFALGDADVDTIVVLTDGSPSGGLHWNLALIGDLFAHENRYRSVVLDAVLVRTRPHITELWKAMCEASGGQARSAEL